MERDVGTEGALVRPSLSMVRIYFYTHIYINPLNELTLLSAEFHIALNLTYLPFHR